MADDGFILKFLEKIFSVSIKSQKEFENSLKNAVETLKLLSLNPYNAFKIIDSM